MYSSRSNPFDDDDDAGFGARSSSSGGRSSSGYGVYSGGSGPRDPIRGSGGYRGDPRGDPRPGAGMSQGARGGYGGYGGYDTGPSANDPVPDYETRMMMANRRMEESSANSLRVLNETLTIGDATAKELDRQAESLDKTERMLDEMHVDLDRGEQHLRKIKSPFGGIGNYFSRKKKIDEVTDPKGFKGKSKPVESKPPQKKQAQKQQAPPQSVGNEIVDRNLDEMEKALHQLHGIGRDISCHLDESDQQIDRIGYKMERNHVKVDKLNKGIKRELYK